MRRDQYWPPGHQEILDELYASSNVITAIDPGPIARAAQLCTEALKNGNKILLCGNGGSAAQAQHIAAELVGRFKKERNPLPAIALTADTSILTAIGNDYGYETVFSRQVAAIGKEGDVLIAITTSGRSKNVLNAIANAEIIDMAVICLTGHGTTTQSKCDIVIGVDSTDTARIQEAHLVIGHVLCRVIEEEFTS